VTIAEQIAELASLEVGTTVIGAVTAAVIPLKLLKWGTDKMMEAFR